MDHAAAPSPSHPTPVADAVRLRPPQPGDLGWVISRHGALYARECGYDLSFEALVARIVADFVERFEPAREAAWIAVRRMADGRDEPLGCVFLVQARDAAQGDVVPGVAQLRLLLVEPAARGLGLGVRLVEACHDFARRAGYRRIRLWTQQELGAARHIYRRAGYRLTASEPREAFGQSGVSEFWELDLG